MNSKDIFIGFLTWAIILGTCIFAFHSLSPDQSYDYIRINGKIYELKK